MNSLLPVLTEEQAQAGGGGVALPPTPTTATAPTDSPHTPPCREGAWQTASLLGGRGGGVSLEAAGVSVARLPCSPPTSAPKRCDPQCSSRLVWEPQPTRRDPGSWPKASPPPAPGCRPGAEQCSQMLPKLDGHRPQLKGAQRPLGAQAPGLSRPGHPSVHQWDPQPRRMGH